MTILTLARQFIQKNPNPLIAVIGPTASGKTNASIILAKELNGEIVNADSRQLFQNLEIATAKITIEEMQNIPHHLFSIIAPNKLFTLAEWKALAEKTCDAILQRGKIPILCGGTGLYLNAITKAFLLPGAPPDPHLRNEMEKLTDEQLFQKLLELNPITKLHQNNRKAVIRAIEIFSANHKTQIQEQSKYQSLILGVSVDRDKLYERINQRVHKMIDDGLFAEVENLLKQGYQENDPGMISHGVPEAISCIQGKITKEEFIEKMQQNTRKYAKRQLTWWRQDKRVIWFDPINLEITNKMET